MNTTIDFEKIRADFPRAVRKTWLAGAEYCPLSVHSIKAIENYTQAKTQADSGYGFGFTAELQAETGHCGRFLPRETRARLDPCRSND